MQLFRQKKYSQAKTAFKKIDSGSVFYEQATYYLGYIYYLENNYEEAKKYFSDINSIEKYQEKMGYYNADMYFKTGAFDKAVEEGIKQLPKANEEEKSELSKIIGESYFNLKQYVNALPYLLEYNGKNGKLSNTDYYQLGYTYYQLKDQQRAISYFNQIINGKDEVAQNAYYHLGECYLALNQKNQAFHAFKNASEMSYNAKIQEDAYANYAKLSYDIGNPYRHISEVLVDFIEKYPQSPHISELEELLVDSYVTSRDFKKAQEILEKHKSIINKPIYQKVLFYRGIEEYNNGHYSQAVQLFNQSVAERQSNQYIARAIYWKAEALYELGDYGEAISAISTFEHLPQNTSIPEYKDLPYFKGYLYMKAKKFDEAIHSFASFIQTSNNATKRMDAELRLADTYFSKGDYSSAIATYNKIENYNPALSDYVAYQKAISLGLNNQNDEKIEALSSFLKKYPKSVYVDDSLYELGRTYANMGNNRQAIANYEQLENQFPESELLPKSMLNKGLAYYKIDDTQRAIASFRNVAAKYPNTEEAIQAVQNARVAYNETGASAEFVNWVKTLDFIDISTAELEQDAYQIADKYRARGNEEQAISAYSDYLRQYPEGSFATASHYYLGELNQRKNQGEAMKHFQMVVQRAKSEYTEPALVSLATFALNKNDNAQAKNYLSQLRDLAKREQNKQFALSNLMKIAYEENDVKTATAYATKLEKDSSISNEIKVDVLVILGREAIENKRMNEAKNYFKELKKIAKGEAAAEALYYEAFFENQDKKYEASNKTIQKISKNYPQYQYFASKSLILMAQNYYALKDAYQATYILESVIENFDYPEVKAQAQELLQVYKNQQSKKNSSIK